MSETLKLFLIVADNLHNINKEGRAIASMNSELFALAMVYMKYDKICIMSELPDFFNEMELYSYEYNDLNYNVRYVVYSSKQDKEKVMRIVAKSMSKL